MSRHAYLIIAHNEFEVLAALCEMIDYVENDIYIHIDKKVKYFDPGYILNRIKQSKVIFIEPRIDVQWGNYSQIECELALLKASVGNKYSYYHLMSGVDLPLKDQKTIHSFFDLNNGVEYIQFHSKKLDHDSYNKVSKYRFITKRNKTTVEKILDKTFLFLQVGVDRVKKSGFVYQKGANWFSITHELAEFVLSQEAVIKRLFSNTLCADEMFLQTIVANSKFIDRISSNNFCDNYDNICYKIDWERGNPYIFRYDDFDELIDSDCLFARKFSWSIDQKIINRIKLYVREGIRIYD